jgi:hypothetical protein
MARKKTTGSGTAATKAPMPDAMDELLREIPEELRNRLAEIVAATDRFCDDHLDAEFKQLCREMAALLCREGFPVASGEAAGWAAGIVYAVGWVNFLGDPSQPHHMKAEDMARAVGVSPATLMNRAGVIREGWASAAWTRSGPPRACWGRTRWSGWSRWAGCPSISAGHPGPSRKRHSGGGSSPSCRARTRGRLTSGSYAEPVGRARARPCQPPAAPPELLPSFPHRRPIVPPGKSPSLCVTRSRPRPRWPRSRPQAARRRQGSSTSQSTSTWISLSLGV